jgi:hypothetical protein
MSAAIVKFKSKGGGFDPVYSAIERHRTAVATQTEASHISCRLDYDDPSYKAADERTREACSELSEALRALLVCRPATMEGLLALLDYVGQPEWLGQRRDGATILSGSYGYDKDLLKEFPRTIAAALREMIG